MTAPDGGDRIDRFGTFRGSRLFHSNLQLAAMLAGGFNPWSAIMIGDSITELDSFSSVPRIISRRLLGTDLPSPSGWTPAAGVFPWDGAAGTTLEKVGRSGSRRRIEAGETLSLAITAAVAGTVVAWANGTVEIRFDGQHVHTGASGTHLHDARGPYTLEVTAVDGPADVEGANLLPSDPFFGVHLSRWGHHGFTTRDVLDNADTWSFLGISAPSLVILATGINDDHLGPDGYRVDMAEAMARVNDLCPDASKIVWVPHECPTNEPGSVIQGIAHDLADRFSPTGSTDGAWSVCDFYAITGPGRYRNPAFSDDGTHLTAAAGLLASHQLADLVVGGFQPHG